MPTCLTPFLPTDTRTLAHPYRSYSLPLVWIFPVAISIAKWPCTYFEMMLATQVAMLTTAYMNVTKTQISLQKNF